MGRGLRELNRNWSTTAYYEKEERDLLKEIRDKYLVHRLRLIKPMEAGKSSIAMQGGQKI